MQQMKQDNLQHEQNLENNYILLGTFFGISADVFMSLESIYEPLGESNTERQEKYQPVFQNKAPNNIFIIKSQNFKMREVKI